MLQNIPIDPVVQQALDAHPREPLVVGVKAWFYSMAELIVTFILSLSPGWNIETYVRVVYHSWFRRAINQIVERRQEAELIRRDELARQERLKPDEIKEEENKAPRESEGSEEWLEDGTIIKERIPREGSETLRQHLAENREEIHRGDEDAVVDHEKLE